MKRLEERRLTLLLASIRHCVLNINESENNLEPWRRHFFGRGGVEHVVHEHMARCKSSHTTTTNAQYLTKTFPTNICTTKVGCD